MLNQIDTDSYLILCCLHQWELDQPKRPSFKDCSSSAGVEAACKVGEWFGLTRRDETKAIGWRPTPLLIDLMFQRRARLNERSNRSGPERWETEAMEMIFEDAFGGDYETLAAYNDAVGRFLSYIGLTKITQSGSVIPTKRLLNDASKLRHRQRRKQQQVVAEVD
jgi:hypothetical protein